MIERLGNLVYWIGCGLAAAFVGFAIIFVATGANGQQWYIGFIMLVGLGLISWGIGRATRYVLAGR